MGRTIPGSYFGGILGRTDSRQGREQDIRAGLSPRGELSRFDSKTKQFLPFLGGISAQGVVFSKDGKSIAYVSYPEGILWKANRDGSNPVQLTDPPMQAFLPRWSPDSKQISFAGILRDRMGSFTLSPQMAAARGSFSPKTNIWMGFLPGRPTDTRWLALRPPRTENSFSSFSTSTPARSLSFPDRMACLGHAGRQTADTSRAALITSTRKFSI